MVILFCNLILRTLELYHSVICQILLNQCKIHYLKSIQFTFTDIHKAADIEKKYEAKLVGYSSLQLLLTLCELMLKSQGKIIVI